MKLFGTGYTQHGFIFHGYVSILSLTFHMTVFIAAAAAAATLQNTKDNFQPIGLPQLQLQY